MPDFILANIFISTFCGVDLLLRRHCLQMLYPELHNKTEQSWL